VIPDLTDDDWDALFAAMQADMPRIWRDIFPQILARYERNGVLSIGVTEAAITVSSPTDPKTAVYRVERKRRLH